jgi:CheY-like chemotaxis protein/HPt (histidine-containing phosphotransfer) domain-containing protein
MANTVEHFACPAETFCERRFEYLHPTGNGAGGLRLIIFSPTMGPQSIPVRVLVVDDDEMSRELLVVLLEAEGYAARSAESGEAALALLSQIGSPPDVVLTDVQLPGVSGSLLADELRRACGPDTLLLAMSGSVPADDKISRFDRFLLKPFEINKVATALASHRADLEAAKSPTESAKWVVVTGPAKYAANPRLVSIQACASSPQPASNISMETMQHAPTAEAPIDPRANGTPAGVPVLNEKIYRQLADSMPARQLREMYAMCLSDARKRIGTMRDLAAAHDGAQFSRQAHAIKGSCGMLGATELHGLAAQLEGRGLDSAAEHEDGEVNSLDELTAACDRLERMLGSRG